MCGPSVNLSLHQQIAAVALQAMVSEALPEGDLPRGVKALDRWSDGRYGAVLFLVDGELDLWDSSGHAVLHYVDADRLADGSWLTQGSGGAGIQEPEELLIGRSSGIYRLGGSCRDRLRLTRGIATSDVGTIRLRNERGVHERTPGVQGFFLLGITHQDPITHAYAVTAEGHEVSDRAILL